jgi:hypothetical protein
MATKKKSPAWIVREDEGYSVEMIPTSWAVTNGEKEFKCYEDESADWLCDVLNKFCARDAWWMEKLRNKIKELDSKDDFWEDEGQGGIDLNAVSSGEFSYFMKCMRKETEVEK